MDDLTAIAELRLRIGDPSPNDVSPQTLRRFYTAALQRLAHRLKWNIPPATTITVGTGVYSVPLPDDLMWLLWLQVGTMRLQPDQANRLILNQFDWANQQPGTTTSFAIQGRSLLLFPPPASDTDFTFSYIANSPGLQPTGVTGLPDQDFQCAIYDAAVEYLSMFNVQGDAEGKRTQALLTMNKAYYETEIANALERWDNPAAFAQKPLQIGGRRAWASR